MGLTSAAVFTKLGHKVWLIEKDLNKIESIKQGKMPFFEPGLSEIVKKSIKNNTLLPTSLYQEGISNADIIFICVGTPSQKNGAADISQVLTSTKELAYYIKQNAIIANKSTVPIGTTAKVKKIIKRYCKSKHFEIASCSEFLKEGSAIHDALNPDRIIIGADSPLAKKVLLEAHKKLPGERVITDIRTAEMIKYASNAFLATKISFINEIANICEKTGANVDDVALGMGLDPRIGKAFLRAGIGYGGSCFPKDTRALHAISLSHNYDFRLLKAVIEVNNMQREKFIKKVANALAGLKNKKIGALGLAFKNNTDDIRESAALEIISSLLKKGAKIKAFDPAAMANAKRALPKIELCKKAEDAAADADALLILTEWQEFKKLPWKSMKNKMRRPIIIDGRNLLYPKKMRGLEYKYVSMGRQ